MKWLVSVALAVLITDATWIPCDEPGLSLLEVETETGHHYRFWFKTKDVTHNEKQIVKEVEKRVQDKESRYGN